MYKYTLTVYLCKIEALRMRYMGRRFYSDENKRVFQSVGKWLNISWSMNGIHSGAEVRSLLKWGKRGDSIFLFLDKRESGIFTSVFEYLPWQGLMKRNDSGETPDDADAPGLVEVCELLNVEPCPWKSAYGVWKSTYEVWKSEKKGKSFVCLPFFNYLCTS